MTTKDIIKILPLEDASKNELLNEFDSLDSDQKFYIEQAIWDVYYEFFDLKMQANLEIALADAKEGQEKLDKEFYNRVREQTEKEMQAESTQTIEGADLAAARTAMEKIIREIRASKKT